MLFVVVLGLACFTATFGYFRAKRVAMEQEMRAQEEREANAGGLN